MAKTVYTGIDQQRLDDSYLITPGPSYALWGRCPWAEFLEDPNAGIAFHEEFWKLPVTAVDVTLDASDDNADMTHLLGDVPNGAIRLQVDSDDNEEIWIQSQAPHAYIAPGKGEMWFEARVRTSSVADNVNGILVGLAETKADGVDVFQADHTAALASVNFVGFHTLQADGDALLAVYRQAGETAVTVQSTGMALVASQWHKLGMHFKDNVLTYFFDGVALGTTLNVAAASTFPDDVYLGWVLAAKIGSIATLNFDCDWIRFAQRRVWPTS